MHNRAPTILVLASAAVLAACSGKPSSETYNWKGPVKQDSWFRLRNTSGDFTVSEGTGDSAMLTLEIERSNGFAPSAQVKVLGTSDGVLACVVYGASGKCSQDEYKGGNSWGRGFLPFLHGETKVSGNIVLPRGVRLDIESTNGDVSVAAASRDLIVRVVNGDISVKGASGPVELHTTNGDIEAGVRDVSGAVNIATTNGDVSLTMPPNLNAALSMQTVNGELDLAFPGTFSQHTKKSIVATLGSGGARIGLATVNGDVTVGPASAAP